jgi:hypothetical protein
MTIEALMEVVPPPAVPSEAFDGPWEQIEAALGKALPQDYKDYVRLYGLGSFMELIWVNVPDCRSPHVRFDAEIRAVRQMFRGYEDFDQLLWPVRGGLLVFGSTDFGDYLFWLTRGPPDEWPVVMWARGMQRLEAFECGLTDFLAGVAKNEIVPKDFPEGECEYMFKPASDFPKREDETF